MADIRQMYIDLLNDYDPYGQDEAENLEILNKNNLNDMLYNLCCIVTLNFEGCTEEELQDDEIYQRMWKLIDILTALGAEPLLHDDYTLTDKEPVIEANNNVYGDISDAMDNIIAKYQNIYGIDTGDTPPDLYNDFCDKINDMAMVIEKILKVQKG